MPRKRAVETFEQAVDQALAEQERQQRQHVFEGGAAQPSNSASHAVKDQRGWSSGEKELAEARCTGRWPDGAKVGRGHGQPYLQQKYALAIHHGTKTVEGRPGIGWATNVTADDWITFKISASGGMKLVARALQVRRFASFEAMLCECGVKACLPDFLGSLQEAVQIYQSFGTMSGATYAELEREFGVIAIEVVPLGT